MWVYSATNLLWQDLKCFSSRRISSADPHSLYKITRPPINVFAISVNLIRNHCSEQQLRQFFHQYEIKQQPLTVGLQSQVYLYWNQFICIARCNHAIRLPVRVPEECLVGGFNIYERVCGYQEGKTESPKCDLGSNFFPGKVTYHKSNRVNERSRANLIEYLYHLDNIQQLIKHPVLRSSVSHPVLYGAGTGRGSSN